jgi:hypothetical protein
LPLENASLRESLSDGFAANADRILPPAAAEHGTM